MSLMINKKFTIFLIIFGLLAGTFTIAAAEDNSRAKTGVFKALMENRKKNKDNPNFSEEGFFIEGEGKNHSERIGDRSYIVYTPKLLPEKGSIPLLIVLHGGFGNASQIQNYIGLDPLADKSGFIIAYLNGMPVAKKLPPKMRGWNAGLCCGQPSVNDTDDIGFIAQVINNISEKYGTDPAQVYGTGHSNGGMMTLRILCETNLYKDGVSLSATLETKGKYCPSAQGKQITNIIGLQDENVPIKGGHTNTGINKITNYRSQEESRKIFASSGATYNYILLDGANHSPETMNGVLHKTEGISLPQKIVNDLGLN